MRAVFLNNQVKDWRLQQQYLMMLEVESGHKRLILYSVCVNRATQCCLSDQNFVMGRAITSATGRHMT